MLLLLQSKVQYNRQPPAQVRFPILIQPADIIQDEDDELFLAFWDLYMRRPNEYK